jgi:hypothetical protein
MRPAGKRWSQKYRLEPMILTISGILVLCFVRLLTCMRFRGSFKAILGLEAFFKDAVFENARIKQ